MASYKKYSKLLDLYGKAYPDKTSAKVQELCSKAWKNCKDNTMKYAEEIASLEEKIAEKRKKQLSLWSAFQAKAKKAGECEITVCLPSIILVRYTG